MQTSETNSGIDRTLSGTPAVAWDSLLHSQSQWGPTAGPVVVVAPHPDDETFGAGGLIHDCVAAGRDVRLLVVTDGEGSHPQDRWIRVRRCAELSRALWTLGAARVRIERLGFAESAVHRREQMLERLLDRHIPRGATVVAPYECDGHSDHDAVGRTCVRLAQARGLRLARYLIWAWQQQTPASFSDAQWGIFSLSESACAAKQRAMACFESKLLDNAQPSLAAATSLQHFARPSEAFLL